MEQYLSICGPHITLYFQVFLLWYLQLYVVPVRLVDGPSPYTGRVEVYARIGEDNNAQWGTICDHYWNIEDARVVCRQLGYPNAVAAPLSAHYGEGTGPILLHNVYCLGTELDIFTCRHYGIGNHECYHYLDASANCLGK